MSGDKDMKILENNGSESVEDTIFVQCVPDIKVEYEEDDPSHKSDSFTNDDDIFKREISDQATHNMEDKIVENELVLQYHCNLCDFQTEKKRYLVEHRKSDHEGKKYECDQCDYQATHKGHLSRHQKSKHEGISASADGGPRSRVRARGTLRSAPHRH